ncbi:hypothetical protein ES705_40548 [subsurface metagenome]
MWVDLGCIVHWGNNQQELNGDGGRHGIRGRKGDRNGPVEGIISGSFTTDEDASIATTLTRSDPDGDALTFTVVDGPGSGDLSGAAPNLTYTPNADYNGSDTFTFTVNDGSLTSEPAIVTITINPVNDTPMAGSDQFNTPEDTPRTLDVLANDTDVDGDNLIITNFRQANGVVKISADGKTLDYAPTPNFSGVDDFFYTIEDGQGGSAEGAVQVTVSGVNDQPVAVDDEAETSEDTPISVNILRNDSDSDGDALSFKDISDPAHGLAEFTGDSTVTYTPEPDFNGSDSFTYTISDGKSTSNSATVTITVAPVNDPPVADAQSVTTGEDTPIDITLSGTDPEGDDLTYTVIDGPTNGVLSGDAPNLTYAPNPEYNGSDSFTFTVRDGQLTSESAIVSITINPVNDPPVAEDQRLLHVHTGCRLLRRRCF